MLRSYETKLARWGVQGLADMVDAADDAAARFTVAARSALNFKVAATPLQMAPGCGTIAGY